MQEDDTMMNVFTKKSVEETYVQLSDGRLMLWEDLVEDYERLLREKNSKEEVPKGETSKNLITDKLEVGKWFIIDIDVIEKNQEKIRRVCGEERDSKGRLYRERFGESNEIANAEPERYPRQIWTFVFPKDWEYKKEQEMRDMCKEKGDGMCDEVICDLELQMRICNGESAEDLFKKSDKLPHIRIIQLRDGGTGYFGGGADDSDNDPPAYLYRRNFDLFSPNVKHCSYTPYAFRRELS